MLQTDVLKEFARALIKTLGGRTMFGWSMQGETLILLERRTQGTINLSLNEGRLEFTATGDVDPDLVEDMGGWAADWNYSVEQGDSAEEALAKMLNDWDD